MSDRTLVTVNVHINDSTEFAVDKVIDFVALRVGDVDLFLMNSEQVSKLLDASYEAFDILKELERKNSPRNEQMLEAGKQWVRAIYSENETYDFSSVARWNLEDWKVVMNRHGSFVPTQEDVDDFKASSSSKYLRGLK